MNNKITLRSLVSGAVLLSMLAGCDAQKTEAPTATTPAPATTTATKVEWPAINSAVKKDPAVETRIDELMAKMTLEEKIGQLIQPEIKFVTPDDIKQYHVGSVLNGGGSTPGSNKYATMEDWVKLADSFYNASVDKSNGRIGIPIMWGTDAVHGLGNVVGATLFPTTSVWVPPITRNC